MKNDILTCPEMRDTFQFQYTSCWYPKKLILRQTSNTSPTKRWGWKSPYTCRFPFCHGGTPSHHPFKLFGIFHEINKEFPCYKPSSYWGIPMAMDPRRKMVNRGFIRAGAAAVTCRDLPWPAGLYQVVYGVEDRVESHHQTHLTWKSRRGSRVACVLA